MITLRDLLPDQPLPAALQGLTVPALRLDSRAVERGCALHSSDSCEAAR